MKLFQQNKNICLKIQKKIDQACNKFVDYGSDYCHLADDYLKLVFNLKRELYFKNSAWEECDNKLYLLIQPCIRFIGISQIYGRNKSDLESIILDHLVDHMRYARTYSDSQEILDRAAVICNSSEFEVRDYISNRGAVNSYIGDSIYSYIKPVIDIILDSGPKVEIKIPDKLYPKVKDRTKLPILIFDPGNLSIDYIRHLYLDIPEGILNSSKVRSVDDVDQFVKKELKDPIRLLNRIPLGRWVSAAIPASEYIDFPINIRLD